MQVLIETASLDRHATAVQWALESKGINCSLLFGADFPSQQTISIDYSSDGNAIICFDGLNSSVTVTTKDQLTYWNRRCGMPQLPASVARCDYDVAQRESHSALAAARRLVSAAGDCFNVNHPDAKACVSHKPMQILIAGRSGLITPDTLVSNSRSEIVDFIKKGGGESLYKTFMPTWWAGQAISYACYATKVTSEDLPSDASLRSSPGIFQRYVDKKFEVRVVAMGGAFFATKLDSQVVPGSEVDWRVSVRDIAQEVIEVPKEIQLKCRKFMSYFGVVFGCFDFVVTPDDQWVFLECNEQGQWLWQEAACPELPLLDAFCCFMIARDPDFGYRAASDKVSYEDYSGSSHEVLAKDLWGRLVKAPEPFQSKEPV